MMTPITNCPHCGHIITEPTIREFILKNHGIMSNRLYNSLERAIAKGHTNLSELNTISLRRITGVGNGTIQEYQTLINN